MHEAAMAESILDAALRIAGEHGSLPVSGVHVRIGELQMVVPEALESAFEAGKRGSGAESAELSWETAPALVRCPECRLEYAPESVFWICPECDSVGGEILSGNEITIVSVELDDRGEQSDEGERSRECPEGE